MEKVLATFRDGRVELASLPDWPDGTPVELTPMLRKIGLSEADWPTTAEGIQQLLEHMHEATSGDDEPIAFRWDWPEWDQYQAEATRKSWERSEKLS